MSESLFLPNTPTDPNRFRVASKPPLKNVKSALQMDAKSILHKKFTPETNFIDHVGYVCPQHPPESVNNEVYTTSLQPSILWSYPEAEDAPYALPALILDSICPFGAGVFEQYKEPQTYIVQLTDEEGTRSYAVVYEFLLPLSFSNSQFLGISRQAFVSHFLFLLSPFSHFSTFKLILHELRGLATGAKHMFFAALVHLTQELQCPPFGQTFVRFALHENVFTIANPPVNEIPICDCDIATFFKLLSSSTIITMFEHVLQEKSLILVSSSPSRMSMTIHVILLAIHPLRWNLPILSVLSPKMMMALSSPVPFLAGLHTNMVDAARNSMLRPITMVNIDTSEVLIEMECPPLPKRERIKLKKRLDQLCPQQSKLRGATRANATYFTPKATLLPLDFLGTPPTTHGITPEESPVQETLEVPGDPSLRREPSFDSLLTSTLKALSTEAVSPRRRHVTDKFLRKDFLSIDSLNISIRPDFSALFNDTPPFSTREARKAFLRCLSSLLLNFESFIRIPHDRVALLQMEDPLDFFDSSEFMASLSDSQRSFFAGFLKTSLFATLLSERLTPSNKAFDVLFFLETIYAKRNRSRFQIQKLPTPFLKDRVSSFQTLYTLPSYTFLVEDMPMLIEDDEDENDEVMTCLIQYPEFIPQPRLISPVSSTVSIKPTTRFSLAKGRVPMIGFTNMYQTVDEDSLSGSEVVTQSRVDPRMLLEPIVALWRIRQSFNRKRQDVLYVQSIIHIFLAKTRYRYMKRTFATMGTLAETMVRRHAFLDYRKKVIQTQSWIRMRREQKHFLKLKSSVLICQKMCRGALDRMYTSAMMDMRIRERLNELLGYWQSVSLSKVQRALFMLPVFDVLKSSRSGEGSVATTRKWIRNKLMVLLTINVELRRAKVIAGFDPNDLVNDFVGLGCSPGDHPEVQELVRISMNIRQVRKMSTEQYITERRRFGRQFKALYDIEERDKIFLKFDIDLLSKRRKFQMYNKMISLNRGSFAQLEFDTNFLLKTLQGKRMEYE
ncbi:hypothetical protein PCE1_004775 [Barthelona sp. PCE]